MLRWNAPTYDVDGVTGYQILRGIDEASRTVHVANTGWTATMWTDVDPPAGPIVYLVRALYDGFYASRESNAAQEIIPQSELGVRGPTGFTVVEGDSGIATLTATGTDAVAPDLVWSITDGADRTHFALSAAGGLAFGGPKNYEEPDDLGADGTYEVTVQVDDGSGVATASLSVTLANRNEAPTATAAVDQAEVEGGDRAPDRWRERPRRRSPEGRDR